jgi:hypothetical protein
MRPVWWPPVGLALAVGFAVSAIAQNPPIQAAPLPPLQEQSRSSGSPAIPRAPLAPTWAPAQGQGVPGGVPGPGLQGLNSPGGAPGPSVQGPGAPGSTLVPTVQGPGAPGGAPGSSTPGPGQTPPEASPATVERPNIWVPAGVAKLQALDKVNAQATELRIKVGQAVTFGSLTIKVKSCMIRPPDQPADAAAYLDITDSHPDSPGFDGWMLQDEPSVSMMQHPIYDLRVTGCA